jgi:hypothetical protein
MKLRETMKGILWMDLKKVREYCNILMVLSIKDIGVIIEKMGMDNYFARISLSITDIGKMTSNMAKGNYLI